MSRIHEIKNILFRFQTILLMSIFLIALFQEVKGQEPPPKPITVTIAQNLGFGAFSPGTFGGTVTVTSGGSRTSIGDLVLLNLGYSFSAAQFRLVGNEGTVVQIMNGPDVSLTGSNGGSMILHIGNSTPLSPLVLPSGPPDYTTVSIGGTLTVGNTGANPPGNYSGSFLITFPQE